MLGVGSPVRGAQADLLVRTLLLRPEQTVRIDAPHAPPGRLEAGRRHVEGSSLADCHTIRRPDDVGLERRNAVLTKPLLVCERTWVHARGRATSSVMVLGASELPVAAGNQADPRSPRRGQLKHRI